MKIIIVSQTLYEEPIKQSYLHEQIKSHVDDIFEEASLASKTLDDIKLLEEEIIDRAKSLKGIEEGQDRYAFGYLAQAVSPDVKNKISNLNDVEIWMMNGVLNLYRSELNRILKEM